MKLKHIALIGSLFPILLSLVLFFGVLISADSDDENSNFCKERGLAVWLWKYVLCGSSQSVFSSSAGIGRTGTKGNE